jgi:hypothetical protein
VDSLLRRLGAPIAVAAVALLGLAATACSTPPTFEQTGGSGGAAQSTGTGNGGTGSAGGGNSKCDKDCGACSKCAEQVSCAKEFAACDSECQAILACTVKQPDQVEICARPFISGLLAFRTLAACLCQSCADTCADCKLLTCLDGMKDGDETAIDCGGSCQKCTGNCSDMIKDNGEVGVDCGGPCVNRCPNGTPCFGNSDCDSMVCVDGVCCADACQGPCLACSAAKKGGGADGTCGPVAAGTDPDAECVSPAADVCNGNGACQCHDGTKDGSESNVDCGGGCGSCNGTCSDGSQNQGETDVDCGGPNCPPCPGGKHCAQNSDCSSAVCNGGTCCSPEAASTTCAGGKCGTVYNNCGQPVNCGGCSAPDVCGAVTANRCGCSDPSACSGRCGTITDGCGQQQNCGGCPGGQACNGTVCQCSDPGACNGKCGILTDGCGQVQNCGGCNPPDTCNGGGPNICGCVPQNNCGSQCDGTVGDGCGGQWTCTGSQCGGGQTCWQSQCCSPMGEAQACGSQCTGMVSDGCGGTVNCSSAECTGSDVCDPGGVCCTPDPTVCDFVPCGVAYDSCGFGYSCPDNCYSYCGGCGYCDGFSCQCCF